MTELGMIALFALFFVIGAVSGIIFISLCISNDQCDDSQESYELGVKNGILRGRAEMRLDMESLCSHCAYYGRKEDD